MSKSICAALAARGEASRFVLEAAFNVPVSIIASEMLAE